MEKGMSLEECLEKAEKYISEQGMCYLAFDVQESSKMSRDFFYKKISSLKKDINKNFMKYFVGDVFGENSRGIRGYLEISRGDSAGTYISSPKAIKEIIDYTKKNYPDFPLKWAVAKDCRDAEIKKL
jgi:hypothetical protein